MSKKGSVLSLSDDSWSEDSSSEDSTSDDEKIVEVHKSQALVSRENQVREILRKHPGLTSNFSVKNKQLKNAYMDVLLDLIQTLCRSIKELSLKDLNKAERTLFDLTRAGLKLGWLRQKLDEAYLQKEKERVIGARIKELEEQVKKRKRTLSDLESELKKEKSAALAAKTKHGFNDVV